MQFIILILLRVIEFYSYILLAYVILTWIPNLYDTALGKMIVSLVRPVIAPFRRLNLQFFGLDWTVFVIWMLLNVLSRILVRMMFFF
ncbi:YggT family protein [Streptococcus varani]|jgi:YggT family protein|uniref:YggT family protein n=1 Tax=Streptococcus varani TaxID=1608583 RepID=A0A0E3WFC9_9STRE|nr:YggT family protein [Streptococcus varani]CQR25286.1 YggT family protein [Streptococcus varani]